MFDWVLNTPLVDTYILNRMTSLRITNTAQRNYFRNDKKRKTKNKDTTKEITDKKALHEDSHLQFLLLAKKALIALSLISKPKKYQTACFRDVLLFMK